jgi:hypothetical protein
MPTDKPRVMLTLDHDTHDLLQKLSKLTTVPIPTIIAKLLGGHLHDLWEYHDWLNKQGSGTRNRALGANLLQSYGPESLMEGIRKIDPTYKFYADALNQRLTAPATKK